MNCFVVTLDVEDQNGKPLEFWVETPFTLAQLVRSLVIEGVVEVTKLRTRRGSDGKFATIGRIPMALGKPAVKTILPVPQPREWNSCEPNQQEQAIA